MDLEGHKSGAEFIDWLETLMAISLEMEKLNYTQQRTSIKRGNLNYEISKTSYKRVDKNLNQYWIFFECGGKRYLISAIYAENNDSEAEKEKLLNSIECQNLRIQKISPTINATKPKKETFINKVSLQSIKCFKKISLQQAGHLPKLV